MNTSDLAKWPESTETVSLVAVGGIPVNRLPTDWKDALKEGFGQGAVLTFGNPKRKTLAELATMCAAKDHLWWLGGLTLTFLIDSEPEVELEIARAGVAHLSWREVGQPGQFLACFDVRELRKYVRHRKDPAFKACVRSVLGELDQALEEICPWLPPNV